MEFLIGRPGRLNRTALRALLEAEGYRTADASDAAYAWGLLDDAEVDVVLLDLPRPLNPERARRIGAALAAANVGLWDWDIRTNRVFFSREWKRQLGCEDHEVGDDFSEWQSRVHPDDLERALASVRAYLANPSSPNYEIELRMRHKDGSYRWILTQGELQRDEHGHAIRMLGSHIDITERKLAQLALTEREQALRESEAHLQRLTDAVPHLIWELTPAAQLRYANRAWREYFGRETLEPHEWGQLVHPDDLGGGAPSFGSLLLSKLGESPVAARLRRADGVYRWFSHRVAPVHDAAGELLYIVGSSTDIDTLKTTQDALAEARTRLLTAMEAAGMGTWRWDVDSDRVSLDPSLASLLGSEFEDLDQLSLAVLVRRFLHPPEQVEPILRLYHDAVARGPGTEVSVEWQARRPDGAITWLSTKGRVVDDPSDGGRGMIGASIDITRSKLLEQQLRQAHKLEAVGLLAGGVAHEFNNILTVILAQASLLEIDPSLPPELAPEVEEIAVAAERAATLIARLLAFGRRQVMNQRDLDLNEHVAEARSLLARLLGERIELQIERAPEPVPVRADPAMLTQILLNLAVNAREAMPEGGRLTLRVAVERREPARAWAQLFVHDNGCGIRPEALPHIFEPFFTTKAPGEGQGLGLATVYGIVQQHRGLIHIDSTPGSGTTVRVDLPLSPSQSFSVVSPSAGSRTPSPKTGSTRRSTDRDP